MSMWQIIHGVSSSSIINSKMPPIGSILYYDETYINSTDLSADLKAADGTQVNDVNSPLNNVSLPNINGGNRFLRGATSSGALVGSTSHSHTNYRIRVIRDDGYSYEDQGYINAATAVPPYYDIQNVYKIKNLGSVKIPKGVIVGWLQDEVGTPALPSSWLVCDGTNDTPNLNLAERFLRGATSSGSVGGALTHTHTHNPFKSYIRSYWSVNNANENLTSVTSGSNLPKHIEVVFVIHNGNDIELPIGSVIGYDKDMLGVEEDLPDNWIYCDGTVKTVPSDSPYGDVSNNYTPPNLNSGKHLRGSNTSGYINSTGTHTHTITGDMLADGTDPDFGYTYGVPNQTLVATEIIPPSMEVCWIMRVA